MGEDCKITVLGGGTGLSVILRGLKKVTHEITAIVTTADDGGGSGKLREDLGMLPPGDIRSCILALADTEEYMEELFQYRFKEGILAGQNFGNLFIAALTGLYDSFQEGIAKIHEILAVTGRVVPVTEENVQLCAILDNGNRVKGESKIPLEVIRQKTGIKQVFLEPAEPDPLPEAIQAILEADIILLGPGSLYTSIIPNLLVKNVTEAIAKSPGIKVYVANVMTQPGETDNYSVEKHIQAIQAHTGKAIIDYVFVNNEKISEDILAKYRQDGANPVILKKGEARNIQKQGIKIIEGSYVDVRQGYIRHDADEIAREMMKLYADKRYQKENQ